jgi:hypothetical protein
LIESLLMAGGHANVSDVDDAGFKQALDQYLAELARAEDGELFVLQHGGSPIVE